LVSYLTDRIGGTTLGAQAMAFNIIQLQLQLQLQHGMSLPEFTERFGTEAQCAQAVKAARWPHGFRCLRCDAAEHWVVGHGARKLFECQACRYQTSLTVGSLLEHTKLPLRTWFLAIYLLSQAKTGLSSPALKRALGVSYPTAWALQHKINHAMALREGQHQLAGTVQLDDAYLGGEHPGGKPGRGSENKTPFVAAVSLNDKGRPQFIKLNRVSGLSTEAIKGWAKVNLAPTTLVVSDGLGCFAAVTAAGCMHTPIVVGGRKPRDLRDLLARLNVDVARCPAHPIPAIRGGTEALNNQVPSCSNPPYHLRG
jgi:transposase-like protein